MKYQRALAGLAVLLAMLTACSARTGREESGATGSDAAAYADARTLILSDGGVTLDGETLEKNGEGAVTVSNDIVYYRDGTDESYGEGTQADMHAAGEADAHTVVTIREAGIYRVSGTLSAGQLSVDLGDDARRNPDAVVTLVLDGVDITCAVAPAVIFYHVYECDEAWVAYDEGERADYSADPVVDTSAAGANVVLADGSVNNISGSYVARIYKEGTTKKRHKYDGAFYSRMSMAIGGGSEGTGVLNITAENEGLDSELHLTINGGNIFIQAQNDGINTNEDGVSVTTVNGGVLQINAGLGDEGDGIDSNGHIVINGGTVYTMASDHSPDGGLDADGEIRINGGRVIALGVRNDAVSANSGQLYMELSFASPLTAGSEVALEGTALSITLEKGAQSIIFSAPELEQGVAYTLKVNGVVQQYTGHAAGGFGGGMGMPVEGFRPSEGDAQFGKRPEEGFRPPEGDAQFDKRPEDVLRPSEGQEPPAPPQADGSRPERPQGGFGGFPDGEAGEPSADFTLTDTVRAFGRIEDRSSAE